MRSICHFWVLLVAVICAAGAAPDFDVFPPAPANRKALVLTQPGCPPCSRMKKELAGREKEFTEFTLEWG